MSEPSLQVFGGNRTNSPNPRELTVREYARLEQVTERTVWKWKEKGAVEYRKTPGGGVRIIVRAGSF